MIPSTTQQQTTNMTNSIDSDLLQYVKNEVAKAGAARKAMPALDMSIMPPAERRERVATLEREAALIKQLTFNLKMAEELQSMRDLILGIGDAEGDDDYDGASEDEFDATQIIANSIQEEVDKIAAVPNLAPANPHRIIADDEPNEVVAVSRIPKFVGRLADTKLKVTGWVVLGTTASLSAIAVLPPEYKSWIFPLLNALGT